MKKYYRADIYHAPSGAHITIEEYSVKAIDLAIANCIEQRNFDPEDCIWTVSPEEI